MKKHILAVIIASAALAGCSSNSSKNDTPPPQEGVADVIYNEDLHSAAIIGDQGNTAIIIADGNGNAAISLDGQIFTIQGEDIVNDQGATVGQIKTENGTATAYIGDTAYTLNVVDGRLVIDSTEFEPDFDGIRVGDAKISFISVEHDGTDTYLNFSVNGVQRSAVIHIDSVTGEFTFSGVGSANGFWFNGYVTETNEYIITGFKGNDLPNHVTWSADGGFTIVNVDAGWGNDANPDDNKRAISVSLDGDNLVITVDGQSVTTDYTAAEDGRGNVTIYDRHGAIKGEGQIIDGQLVFGNGIVVDDRGNITIPTQDENSKEAAQLPVVKRLTIEQKDELKNSIKALTTEQRQQIKQAVKTQLQTRS
ncbi:hypothetical protein FR932_13035 [Moritella marina ATCC 15381]|uniref:Uncharacterized protein n=1 Tax=Moritella marina ATCC 15381 TaxID=1202962 RepID=A0A5J6WP54_MORMI|nr:hypothetical protein [Moritella marina]QFI38710.1 hypothetical protein FR932_13035 [Moritella marina ATCC 15381]